LYAAIDPLHSINFGYGNWSLLELKLPKNLRILNLLSGFGELGETKKVQATQILNYFECPAAFDANTFLNGGGAGISQKCQNLMRRIFRDELKIDAFAYSYGSSQFKSCNISYENGVAFVITNGKWINNKNFEIYTQNSTKNFEERVRIQTLLLEANQQQNMNKLSFIDKANLISYLKQNPNKKIISSQSVCDQDYCTLKITLCDSQHDCSDFELSSKLLRPGGPLISQAYSQKVLFRSLLWNDLDGVPKSKNIKTWINDHIFGCGPISPYKDNN
ncbi:MAG: hypothetical protein KDD45_11180, partial [Bdellovibrionales bacterium]|nr:hypothetical protein [Bdellovibrionales bacterium]